MYKNLFFDDQRLFGRENLERCYGEPELVATYNDGVSFTSVEGAYVFLTDDGKYRLLYQAKVEGHKGHFLFIAVSDDGIHFAPEDISNCLSIEDRIASNEVMHVPDGEIAYIIEDNINSPEERYKLLRCDTDIENVTIDDIIFVSPDLIHWKKLDGICWHKNGTEPCMGVFYNKYRECFTIMTRPRWGVRRVGYIETKDWRTFTDFTLCLQCDSLDAPLDEIYGMPTFEYDGWYIGMPYIYGDNKSSFYAKYTGGTMKAQLAYSLDGRHWQRSLRVPFISGDMPHIAEKVGYKCNLVWPSDIQRKADAIYIYGAACDLEHGYAFDSIEGGKSSIHTYKLRRDGFIGLKTVDSSLPSFLATRENIWCGGEAHINIRANNATVAVYESSDKEYTNVGGCSDLLKGYTHDNCIAFSGDSTDWVPTFKNGKTLNDLKGKTLALEVKFESGEIYSISGDYIPVMNTEGARYRKFGIIPECSKLY